MHAQAKSQLYDKVVDVTRQYFGPAAERFVSRQISSHLHKRPEQLQAKDLAALIDWIGLTMALLIEDQSIINHYVADLTALAARKDLP